MNLIPNYLRMCHLQNIIDQAPKAHSAERARELMAQLKPAPGHEPDDCYAVEPQSEILKDEVAG